MRPLFHLCLIYDLYLVFINGIIFNTVFAFGDSNVVFIAVVTVSGFIDLDLTLRLTLKWFDTII